jgi:hypothetical protein
MFRITTTMIMGLALFGLVLGCGNYTDTPVMKQQDRISDCGGFAKASSPLLVPKADYCAAEVLHWTYESDTQTLKLADARVLLNCCGDHGFTVEEQNGVYIFTQTDAPEGGLGRCGCMCVFDFVIEVQGIPAGTIPIRIARDVTDWPEGSGLVIEADLDLTQGSGSIVVDETDVGPWCEEEAEECTPLTCEDLSRECGTWGDGCGGYLDCGGCSDDLSCNTEGVCVLSDLIQADRISACGGFQAEDSPGSTDYCAAEMLHWTYASDTQTLKLTDARVLLNCCGNHSFTVEEQNGVYVFTQTDAPDGGGVRCPCMCVFDFVIEVQGIPAGTIPICINRDVTDRPESSSLVIETDLDLTQGSGSIVIDDTDVDPWCEEA